MTALPHYPAIEETPTEPVATPQTHPVIRFVEYGAAFGWLASISSPFPGAGIVRNLCVLLLLSLVWLHRREVWATFRPMAPLALMPALLLLSILWTTNKVIGAQYAILYTQTFIYSVYFASRLSFLGFFQCIMAATAIGAVASAMNPTTHTMHASTKTADIGVFSQKNVLGKRMMLLCISSAFIFLSKSHRLWKIASVVFIILGYYLAIRSNSTTAAVLTTVGLLGVGVGRWGTAIARAFPPAFYLAIGALVVLGVTIGFFAAVGGVNLWNESLEALGKNSTLTGRTLIWSYAPDVIAQHPWLGHGVSGFWRPGQYEAVQITNAFALNGSTYSFNFHSAYIEHTVHLGYVGGTVFALMIAFCVGATALDFVRFRDIRAATGLLLVLFLAIRTFSESELYATLEVNRVMLWTLTGFAVARLSGRDAEA